MTTTLVQRRLGPHEEEALRRCEGFSVHLGERTPPGVVEEVWLGTDRRPAALVVSLPERRHAVAMVEEIVRVDPERRAVQLDARAELVDLEAV